VPLITLGTTKLAVPVRMLNPVARTSGVGVPHLASMIWPILLVIWAGALEVSQVTVCVEPTVQTELAVGLVMTGTKTS